MDPLFLTSGYIKPHLTPHQTHLKMRKTYFSCFKNTLAPKMCHLHFNTSFRVEVHSFIIHSEVHELQFYLLIAELHFCPFVFFTTSVQLCPGC